MASSLSGRRQCLRPCRPSAWSTITSKAAGELSHEHDVGEPALGLESGYVGGIESDQFGFQEALNGALTLRRASRRDREASPRGARQWIQAGPEPAKWNVAPRP